MTEIVVFITVPSQNVAEQIGRHLVEQQLAACVNIVPSVTSIFRWEGKTCCEAEVLMILKTGQHLFKPLCEAVKKEHPYTTPEIIALPLVAGSEDYIRWVRGNILSEHS